MVNNSSTVRLTVVLMDLGAGPRRATLLGLVASKAPRPKEIWAGQAEGIGTSQKDQGNAFRSATQHQQPCLPSPSPWGLLPPQTQSVEAPSPLNGELAMLSSNVKVSKARCHHPPFLLHSFASYTPGMIYFWFISCDSVTQDAKL